MRLYSNRVGSIFKCCLFRFCVITKVACFKYTIPAFVRHVILRPLNISLFAIILLSFSNPVGIYHFDQDFSFEKVAFIKAQTFNFNDQIPNDSLFICFSKDSIPEAYYRNIFTPVCFDGQCKPIYIALYWTPGGAYLGYALEEKEILTKGEEENPFTAEDYLRLHQLLGDPYSVLKNYPLYEAAVTDENVLINNQVDAISGATNGVLENYVVPGAVYTTNTLYHVVHGNIADSVRMFSSKDWSNKLFKKLVTSNKITDNEFGISKIDLLDMDTLRDFIPILKELIHSSNFLIQENTIKNLIASKLPVHEVQRVLAQIFCEGEYELKQLIINYLKSYEDLDNVIYPDLFSDLSQESGYVVQGVFSLLEQENDPSDDLIFEISDLLKSKNKYIVNLAFNYLSSREHQNTTIAQKLIEYKNNQK